MAEYYTPLQILNRLNAEANMPESQKYKEIFAGCRVVLNELIEKCKDISTSKNKNAYKEYVKGIYTKAIATV